MRTELTSPANPKIKYVVKLRSCATLFDIVSPGDVFADILDAFYYGKPCARTLSILNSISEAEVNG